MSSSANDSNEFPFDVVVVTSPDPDAAPVQTLKPHLPANVELHSTTDPFGARCGSGGGTLAALEYCHAEKQQTVLIIHAGGESSRCPTQMVLGKAWTSLPMCEASNDVMLSNPTVLILQVLSRIFRDIPKGSIVVAASDCLVDLPPIENVDWNGQYRDCVLGVAVPSKLSTAKNHGVFCIHNDKVVEFLQKPTLDTMKETPHCVFGDEQAWIDTGIVGFVGGAADVLRSLVTCMQGCTESGLRRLYENESLATESLHEFAHRRALRVELYTHLMMASSFSSFEAYYQACGADGGLPLDILQELYNTLSPFPLQAMTMPKGTFTHLGTTRELLEFYFSDKHIVKRAHSFLPYVPQTCVAINVVIENSDSISIGTTSVLEHLHVSANKVDIGKECLLSGIRGKCDSLVIPNKMVFQMIPLQKESAYVYMYFGLDDGIKKGNTMWGIPMTEVFHWLNPSDLWDEDDGHTVWKARMHPIIKSETNECMHDDVFYWITELQQKLQNKDTRTNLSDHALASLAEWKGVRRLSLSEIRPRADAVAEFQYRDHLERKELPKTVSRHCRKIQEVLLNRQHTECKVESFIGLFAATACWSEELTELVAMFDTVILDAFDKEDYDISGRASMILSDLFYRLSAETGPIESSNAKTTEMDALELLQVTDRDSLVMLQDYRDSILDNCLSSSALVSCATAMEQCASAMTERCVANSTAPSSFPQCSPAPLDTWVVATAPARIDLAGGWSDTPPICIEHGGAVCNVAVTVDGHKPLSCRCRLISSGRGILLRSEGRDIKTGELTSETIVSLHKIADLEGYNDPKTECSLLKCALVYCGLVSAEKIRECSNDELSVYLKEFCGVGNVGMELVTTSLLPHGSGMGTSSILGGCILSAITKCVGIDMSGANLVHMVLMLEQLLCTGGGWQDQVGGLIGGAKLCTSQNNLPLQVQVEQVRLSPTFEEKLNQRLLLVFTGQTRLAKNILQNVLRRWARRSTDVVKTVEQLTSGALKARDCFKDDDLDGLADCLNAYWNQKKIMAGESSEPVAVRNVLTELLARDFVQAGSLCGAGGGGFMVLMLKEGREPTEIQEFCANAFDSGETGEFTWHECRLSQEGLTTVVCENGADFDMRWQRAPAR